MEQNKKAEKTAKNVHIPGFDDEKTPTEIPFPGPGIKRFFMAA